MPRVVHTSQLLFSSTAEMLIESKKQRANEAAEKRQQQIEAADGDVRVFTLHACTYRRCAIRPSKKWECVKKNYKIHNGGGVSSRSAKSSAVSFQPLKRKQKRDYTQNCSDGNEGCVLLTTMRHSCGAAWVWVRLAQNTNTLTHRCVCVFVGQMDDRRE
jgi:hypothetical protein